MHIVRHLLHGYIANSGKDISYFYYFLFYVILNNQNSFYSFVCFLISFILLLYYLFLHIVNCINLYIISSYELQEKNNDRIWNDDRLYAIIGTIPRNTGGC